MRRTYVFRMVDGKYKAIPKDEAAPARQSGAGPYVMPDIQSYQSIITGEQISSRSRHREHLRRHNCEEVGDQAPKWLTERQREQREGQ